MPYYQRRIVTAFLIVVWLLKKLPVIWHNFITRYPKLIRRTKTTLSWLPVILFVWVTVLFNLGTYRSNSGTVDFPKIGERPAISLPFTCGTVPPANPLYGNGVAVFHGQSLPMRAIHNLGPTRLQISTNVSVFDMEDAATRLTPPQTATLTQKAFVSTCTTYFENATIRLEIEVGIVCLCGLIIWRREMRKALPRALVYIALAQAVWFPSLYLAQHAATGLKETPSLSAVFGYEEFRTDPAAVGPIDPEPVVVVGEDSRMSGWNGSPLVANATPEDQICSRTQGNVGEVLQELLQVKVLNTSCPGGDLLSGIETPEFRHGQWLPTQFGVFKSTPNAQYYVLDPLPNREGYGLVVGSAIKTDVNFPGIPIAVDSTIDELRPVMDDLIKQLRTLHENQPGHPKLILVGTYDAFRVGLHCKSTPGISDDEMRRLNAASTTINQYLASVAANNTDFVSFVQPYLPPLCSTDTTHNGPALVGDPNSPYYIHPTPWGESLLGAEVAQKIHLDVSRLPQSSEAQVNPSNSASPQAFAARP